MFNLYAAVWGALSKAADKQFDRSDLVDGSRHAVKLSGVGSVDGVAFAIDLDTVVKVGHASVNTRSVPVEHVRQLAYVLELVELAFGADAVSDVVRDVAAKFAESGSVPASDRFLAIAGDLDKALRVAKPVAVAGAVRVDCVDSPMLALACAKASKAS